MTTEEFNNLRFDTRLTWKSTTGRTIRRTVVIAENTRVGLLIYYRIGLNSPDGGVFSTWIKPEQIIRKEKAS